MIDLVQRLRSMCGDDPNTICTQAADEIERLRKEVNADERNLCILTDALAACRKDAARYKKLAAMEADLVEPITIWHYLRNPDDLDAAMEAK